MTTALRPRSLLNAVGAPFDQVERALSDWFGWQPEKGPVGITPVMDVHEDDDTLTVAMELPGLTREQIEVTLEGGVLTVSGEKQIERKKEGKRYYTVERRTGSFRRSVSLPTDVNVEKASARFENGVLTITVPKSESVKPKRLTVG